MWRRLWSSALKKRFNDSRSRHICHYSFLLDDRSTTAPRALRFWPSFNFLPFAFWLPFISSLYSPPTQPFAYVRRANVPFLYQSYVSSICTFNARRRPKERTRWLFYNPSSAGVPSARAPSSFLIVILAIHVYECSLFISQYMHALPCVFNLVSVHSYMRFSLCQRPLKKYYRTTRTWSNLKESYNFYNGYTGTCKLL